jgi:hypothetical protein
MMNPNEYQWLSRIVYEERLQHAERRRFWAQFAPERESFIGRLADRLPNPIDALRRALAPQQTLQPCPEC